MMMNTDYNFDELQLVEERCTDYVPIEEFEEDEMKRKYQYPNVTKVKTETKIYFDKDKKITRNIYHYVRMVPKRVLERQKWKPFGRATDGVSVTSLGDEVFLELSNPEPIKDKIEKHMSTVGQSSGTTGPSLGINIPSGRYVPPSMRNRTQSQKLVEDTEIRPTKTVYVPPSKRKGFERSTPFGMTTEKCSIVISNLPDYIELDELKYKIEDIFGLFGRIKKYNILTSRRDGSIRGIAFVDYYSQADAQTAIDQANNSHIEHNIIKVEFTKPKRR